MVLSVPCGGRIRRGVMCGGAKRSGSGPGQGCRGCGRLTEEHFVQAWVVVEHAVRKCHELVVVCAYGEFAFRPCDVRHERVT